jgi:hypothetical protein
MQRSNPNALLKLNCHLPQSSSPIAQAPRPINPDASGHVHTDKPSSARDKAKDPHPHGIPPAIDQGGVSSSDDDEVPLSKKGKPTSKSSKPASTSKPSSSKAKPPSSNSRLRPPPGAMAGGESSSEDERPLSKTVASQGRANGESSKKPASKQAKNGDAKANGKEKKGKSAAPAPGSSDLSEEEEKSAASSSSEDEKPLAKVVPKKKQPAASGSKAKPTAVKKGGKKAKSESEGEEEDVKPKVGKNGKATTTAKRGKKAKEEDEEDVKPDVKAKGKGRAKKEEEGDEDELVSVTSEPGSTFDFGTLVAETSFLGVVQMVGSREQRRVCQVDDFGA